MLSLNLWYLRFWLVFGAITLFVKSDAAYAVYAVSDTFPAIIGIANLLIHARVGLGWSHDQTFRLKQQGIPAKGLSSGSSLAFLKGE